MAVPPLDLQHMLDLPDQTVDGDGVFWWQGEKNIAYHNIRKWHGRHWAEKVRTSIGFRDINHQWRGVRPLGEGGQGWAALYERTHPQTGRSLDWMVLKQSLNVPGSGGFDEARAMAQANRKQNPNIVKLRSFKRYRDWKGNDQYRFYLEYCRYGDLSMIDVRYKHFGQYFPELFVWHVFHDLANAAVTFATGAWSSWHPAGRGRRGELVHFDIKSTNIFLSDSNPQGNRDTRFYPTVKVGDFGLAEITYDGDPKNPRDYDLGTQDLMAPEQDDMSQQFQEWWPPNRQKPWLPLRPFDQKHNVFAIGVVMWELLTLDGFLLPLVYHSDHGIQPDGHIMPSITTMRGSPQRPGKKVDHRSPDPGEYSDDLRALIRECLHPDPEERPTAQELFNRILDGVDECVRREGDSRRSQNKVYYRGNEINDMKPGTLFWPLFDWIERIRGRRLTQGGGRNPGFKRPGWVSEAIRRAEGFRRQDRQDRDMRQTDERNTIDAPIIFPKLRWFPSKNEFYLMKKRQKRGTRWASTQPPETMYNMFEEVRQVDGSTRIQKKEFNFDRRKREKNVWIGKYREHGTLRREKLEIASHKPPSPPPPPPPDDSDDGSSDDDKPSASTTSGQDEQPNWGEDGTSSNPQPDNNAPHPPQIQAPALPFQTHRQGPSINPPRRRPGTMTISPCGKCGDPTHTTDTCLRDDDEAAEERRRRRSQQARILRRFDEDMQYSDDEEDEAGEDQEDLEEGDEHEQEEREGRSNSSATTDDRGSGKGKRKSSDRDGDEDDEGPSQKVPRTYVKGRLHHRYYD